jgi:hypothetical protein
MDFYQTSHVPSEQEMREALLSRARKELHQLFSEEELQLLMDLPSNKCWQVFLKYLSQLEKAYNDQIWAVKSMESHAFLRGQKDVCMRVQRCPEEIKRLVKQSRGEVEDE